MHRTNLIAAMLLAAFFSVQVAHAETEIPLTLAGITLGQNISDYEDLIIPETKQAIWKNEHLSRASIARVDGVDSGYITYGNCAVPGRIVRLKIALDDDRADTFDRLYREYRERFGKDPEWRGDPFGTLKVWKWSVRNDQHSISIILQYYTGTDDTFTPGITIRLADRAMMDEEEACFDKMHGNMHRKKQHMKGRSPDIDWFVPR